MKLITRQDKANGAARDFAFFFRRYSYRDGLKWSSAWNENLYKQLVALGSNPNPDDVEKLIPNWTLSFCSSCYNAVNTVVRVYDSKDSQEDHDVDLCLDCLKIATEIAETAR